MLVATQWKVVFCGTTTKNGLVETTYVKTFSLEKAKEVYQEYIERARKANKKITGERYNRKKQEWSNGKLDTIFYDGCGYGYQTYHVYVIEIDWENE